MKSILINLMVISLVLLASASVTAEKLTLDDCIELALKNRASIIRAHGDETLAKAGRLASLGAFLPQVSARFSYSKSRRSDYEYDVDGGWYPSAYDTAYLAIYDDPSVSTPTGYAVTLAQSDSAYFPGGTIQGANTKYTSKSYGLSAGMSLFDLSNWFNLFAANANVAKSKLDIIASEQDMIYSIKISFYAYLASMENMTVQEEAVKRSEEQLKLIQSKFELGSAAKSDVLKQKVQFGRDRQYLLEASNSVISTQADLAFAIGLDPSKDYDFSTDYIIREYDDSLDDAVAFGLANRPSLLSSQKGLVIAKHNLRSAQSRYLPTVSASYSHYWSEGTSGFQDLFKSSQQDRSIGLTASWNIFDGFSREHNISRVKIARNNAQAGYAEYKHLVSLNIKKAYLDINKTREQLKVAQENVEAASEDMKITQEKYNLGAATILLLLDAQVSLKQAQVDKIRAGFNLNLAVAKLENAMGKM